MCKTSLSTRSHLRAWLMLSGRVCILRKDWGGAGQKFDEVLNYEPDNIEALKLSARVYKYVNPIVAQETLKKILEKEPENLDAHKELGDIAYTNQSFKDAAKAYKTVFDRTKELTLENVPAGVNYLTALMLTGGDAYTITELAQKTPSSRSKELLLSAAFSSSQTSKRWTTKRLKKTLPTSRTRNTPIAYIATLTISMQRAISTRRSTTKMLPFAIIRKQQKRILCVLTPTRRLPL